MNVVILGCGYHGRGIAYEIAGAGDVTQVRVADKNASRAKVVAEKTGVDWLELDVRDGPGLRAMFRGMDLVFNAVGPYHRYALGVIEAAIDAGVNYVDMCDDHEVAEALFFDPQWNSKAKSAGVTLLVGLGMAPGVSGILARLGCEQFDAAEVVSTQFVWNYAIQYPAAIQHFLRINSGQAPQYIKGEYRRPGPFAGHEMVDFLGPVGKRPVFYTGIIDPITIPSTLPGLHEVTTKGAFLQPEANAFLRCMVRWGMTRYDIVQGMDHSPMAFLMAYLTSEQGGESFNIEPLKLPMAVRVEVSGTKGGEKKKVTYEAHDYSRRGSTSTSALASLDLLRQGSSLAGVKSPEGCIEPLSFLSRLVSLGDVEIFQWWEGAAPRPLFF